MLERGKLDRGILEIVDTESLVPEGHLLRKIDAAVDFNRIYEMVESLYSEDNGRPSIDPVVLFKMVLIQHLYGLPSLRRTAEEVSGSINYRWFLGYTLREETPHHGKLQLPAPVHRGNGGQGVCMDIGGSSRSGIPLAKSDICGRDTHQSKREHKETGKRGNPVGIEAVCQGTDGGSERGQGSAREKAV